jgi:hypothetical protein
MQRVGNPHDTEPWEWRCGFYPGSRAGECSTGTAETFDQARAEFDEAWRVFLAKRTEADFRAWREQRDWTARKHALWEASDRLPLNKTFDSTHERAPRRLNRGWVTRSAGGAFAWPDFSLHQRCRKTAFGRSFCLQFQN